MKTIKPKIEQPDVALYGDIVYSNQFNRFLQENIPLKMHILRPFYDLEKKWEKLPLLIWVGGGAFRGSTPLRRIPELTWFAMQGFVVASIQYRVSDQQIFPAQIQDVKAAIRFLRAHAEQYGIDSERVALAGDSAGGHLVTLSGLSTGVTEFNNGEWAGYSDEVKAVISWYGAGDISTASRDATGLPFTLLLGGTPDEKPELARLASPSEYIRSDAPPFLIMHGTADPLVDIEKSKTFYRQLIKAGVTADMYLLDSAGHGTIEFVQPEVHNIMLEFLRQYV